MKVVATRITATRVRVLLDDAAIDLAPSAFLRRHPPVRGEAATLENSRLVLHRRGFPITFKGRRIA